MLKRNLRTMAIAGLMLLVSSACSGLGYGYGSSHSTVHAAEHVRGPEDYRDRYAPNYVSPVGPGVDSLSLAAAFVVWVRGQSDDSSARSRREARRLRRAEKKRERERWRHRWDEGGYKRLEYEALGK